MLYLAAMARIDDENRELSEEIRRLDEPMSRPSRHKEDPDPCVGFSGRGPTLTKENYEQAMALVKKMRDLKAW